MKKSFHATMVKGLVLSALVSFAASAAASLFETNLIVNGNAEAGPGSTLGDTVMPVPGWTTANGFTVTLYGTASDIPTNCPGPVDRGTNLFTGGLDTTGSSAFQIIDLSGAAAQIDAGTVFANLNGYLGGWQGQNDAATLKADFTDGVHTNVLRNITLGPVLAADRTNVTALLYREKMSPVPAGSRQVKITLIMTYTTGSYTDGYADNLGLLLTTNRPALNLTGGNDLTVLWLTNYARGYVLQQSTNLSSTNWAVVTNTVVLVNGTNQIIMTNGPAKFFRLYHP
ncbi:MAG TPA: hypothetical protein VF988_10565 [Verrucomicrobiae bacterium]